jgi:hypothetical protein
MMTSSYVRSLRLAVLVSVLSLIGSSVVLSQKAGGEIRGTVRDASGAIVTVAVVTVQNEATGWASEATLNGKGEFVLRPVPEGTYRFEILSPGFKRYARRGLLVGSQGTPEVVAKLESGPIAGVLATLGGGHVVLGYGWNDAGYGNWSHTYAVLVTPRGRVIGKVKVSFVDVEAAEYSLDYTNEVECVEIDADSGSAWLGGRISRTSNPSYIPLGTYVVDFARDGGPGNAGDFHGDALPGLDGQPETCHERYGPYYMDPVEKGNIVVR